MKIGRNLVALKQEIERQVNTKVDIVAPTKKMELIQVAGQPGVMSLVVADKGAFQLNEIAHQQLAGHTGVPQKYYDKMRQEEPDLLARNINTWLHRNAEKRLCRVLDNRLRAFLSDGFKTLDNFDLAKAVLPVLEERGAIVMSAEITERRLYIKAIDSKITADIERVLGTGAALGDGSHRFVETQCAGLTAMNSEVGYGRLVLDTGVYNSVCTNLAMLSKSGLKRTHIGARHDLGDDDVALLLTDETKTVSDQAFWLKVRDVAAGAFDEAKFKANVDKIAGMKDEKIEDDVVVVVQNVVKKFDMTEAEGKIVQKHLIEGGDLTRYGMYNAITRTAQDLEDYDRATDFEYLGGRVIELPKSEWKTLAQAA